MCTQSMRETYESMFLHGNQSSFSGPVEGRKCRSGDGTAAFVHEVTAPSPTTEEVTDYFHANLMNSRDRISLVRFWKHHGDLVLKVLKESSATLDRALCTRASVSQADLPYHFSAISVATNLQTVLVVVVAVLHAVLMQDVVHVISLRALMLVTLVTIYFSL